MDPTGTGNEIMILALAAALFVGATYICARRKGYNPFYFLIGGLPLLAVLAFLPSTAGKHPPTQEDIDRRVQGNGVGLACSSISVLATLAFVLMINM